MKAWLFAERLYERTAFTSRIVYTGLQASELTEHDAHEVMRGAERTFQNTDGQWSTLSGAPFFLPYYAEISRIPANRIQRTVGELIMWKEASRMEVRLSRSGCGGGGSEVSLTSEVACQF
jgi:hypothetical protein